MKGMTTICKIRILYMPNTFITYRTFFTDFDVMTENINTLKLDNCGHIFCEKRIQKWKSYNKNTCPCCRTNITSDFVNDSYSDSDDSEFEHYYYYNT